MGSAGVGEHDVQEEVIEKEKLRMGGWTFPTTTTTAVLEEEEGPPLVGIPQLQRSGGTLSSNKRSPAPPMLRLPHIFPTSPNPSLHPTKEDHGGSSAEMKRSLSQEEREDYRRRRNNDSTSLAYVGTTRRPLTSSPSSFISYHINRIGRVFGKKSVLESFMAIAFVGSMIMFFAALSGVGYVDQSGRTWPTIREIREGEGIKVEIPPNYRLKIISDSNPPRPTDYAHPVLVTHADIPADVHHPTGDSTHETPVEMMLDSPDDSALDDEHVHHTHGAKRPLFGDHEDGEEEEEVVVRGHRGHSHRLAGEEEEEEEEHEDGREHEEELHGGEESHEEDSEEGEDDFKAHYPSHSTTESIFPDSSASDSHHEPISDEESAGNIHRRPNTAAGIALLRAERERLGEERVRWEESVVQSRRRE